MLNVARKHVLQSGVAGLGAERISVTLPAVVNSALRRVQVLEFPKPPEKVEKVSSNDIGTSGQRGLGVEGGRDLIQTTHSHLNSSKFGWQ